MSLCMSTESSTTCLRVVLAFGLVVGVYGVTMVLGQAFLGPLSDKYGRKSVIVTGTVIETVFYAGLIFLTSFPLMIIAAAISGLGTALIEPAMVTSHALLKQATSTFPEAAS